MADTPTTQAKQLGESVRALRLGRSLSQEDLAKAAGVSSTLISRVERGGDVKMSNILAVAQALEVTMDELLQMKWDTCPKCKGSGVIHLPFVQVQPLDPLPSSEISNGSTDDRQRYINFPTGNGLSD